jgi:hypothetical protein
LIIAKLGILGWGDGWGVFDIFRTKGGGDRLRETNF